MHKPNFNFRSSNLFVSDLPWIFKLSELTRRGETSSESSTDDPHILPLSHHPRLWSLTRWVEEATAIFAWRAFRLHQNSSEDTGRETHQCQYWNCHQVLPGLIWTRLRPNCDEIQMKEVSPGVYRQMDLYIVRWTMYLRAQAISICTILSFQYLGAYSRVSGYAQFGYEQPVYMRPSLSY